MPVCGCCSRKEVELIDWEYTRDKFNLNSLWEAALRALPAVRRLFPGWGGGVGVVRPAWWGRGPHGGKVPRSRGAAAEAGLGVSVLECLGAWCTPESGPRWPFGAGFRAPREGAGRAGRGP